MKFTQIADNMWICQLGAGVLTVTYIGAVEYMIGYYSGEISVKRTQNFESHDEAMRYAANLIVGTLKTEVMEIELG